MLGRGISAEVDTTVNTLSRKVREAYLLKFNYVFVVGDKEECARTVSIRGGNEMTLEGALEMLCTEARVPVPTHKLSIVQ